MNQPWSRRIFARGILRLVVEEIDYTDLRIANQSGQSRKSVETKLDVVIDLFQNPELISAQLAWEAKRSTILSLSAFRRAVKEVPGDRSPMSPRTGQVSQFPGARVHRHQHFPERSSPESFHKRLLSPTKQTRFQRPMQFRSLRPGGFSTQMQRCLNDSPKVIAAQSKLYGNEGFLLMRGSEVQLN